MSKVVDMNERRLQGLINKFERTGEAPPASTGLVAVIGCANCGSPNFQLTNDKRVICSGCHHLIVSIGWFDVNAPPAPVA